MQLISINEGASRALLSRPSYYRLAAEQLMPPVVQISPNRSGIIAEELDAVIAARAIGATHDQVKALVQKLVAKRRELVDEVAA